jgi:hypothetical protein
VDPAAPDLPEKSLPLRIVGWLLLCILAVWIIVTALGMIDRPSLPRLFGFDVQHAAEYNFSAEAQHQLEQAQARLDSTNHTYSTFRWGSDMASWVSFLSTSLIALITGGFNLPMPRAGSKPARAKHGQVGRFHILGFLAAVASVCTLLAAQLNSGASTTLACSKELRDRITESAQTLKDNPRDEFIILNHLRDTTSRRCS